MEVWKGQVWIPVQWLLLSRTGGRVVYLLCITWLPEDLKHKQQDENMCCLTGIHEYFYCIVYSVWVFYNLPLKNVFPYV